MITVIIVGAGGVSAHLATALCEEQHNVFLIDTDETRLEAISQEIEVGTRKGSGTDWELLDQLLDLSPHVLLALTDNDEINLVTCSIAKHLGYPRTIARLKNPNYLNTSRLDFSHLFAVDTFISPEIFVANAIYKYMIHPSSHTIETFAHGAVQLRTFTIPENWNKANVMIQELQLPENALIALIYREEKQKNQLIFPHGNDFIKPGDEVTIIAETDMIARVYAFFNISEKMIHSAMVVGGSKTGLHFCRLLEKARIGTRLIDKSYKKCSDLVDTLTTTAVIHHDGTDINFLKAEKIDQVDLFVATTRRDDTNLLLGQLAKEAGCKNVVAILEETKYTSLAKKTGIDEVISPYISSTNHLLAQIFTGRINSLISLYDNRAEVIEIKVSIESHIVGIPLSELSPLLPKGFLIALIENRGRIMIGKGNRILSPGDTIIVISKPEHLTKIEKIF